jgi:nitrite reductase/ring-hydroxylating ferredoxin subunit/uncharacterized membrane protein
MVIARRTRLDLTNVSDRLVDSLPGLDKAASTLHAAFDPLLGAKGIPLVKDALYGTWLGHPLHPVMTDIPIGFWTSSMVLDVAGRKKSADLMLKLGTVSALGTALSGMAQWHDLQEMKAPRRLGALHAILNVAATASYGVSWLLRDQKSRQAGIVFSTAGFTLASASGMLGGDLAYRLGIGVSRDAFAEPRGKWTAVIALEELEAGTPRRVTPKRGESLVLLRDGEAIYAAAATCTHVGGPLDEGTVDGACITCPWHGSVFDLRDGHVIHGPASSPIRAYETRVSETGQVEVRPL